MTIAQALKKYTKIEADLLLAHILKQPKEFLYLHPQFKLTKQQQLSLESMAQKRKDGMPVAYLLGYKYFYGLKFKVNKHVLIPRPETEWIVDQALGIIESSRKRQGPFTVLDIGTGSGCIAVSVAKHTEKNKVSVTATDISSTALKVAAQNILKHKVFIKLLQRDLLKNVQQKFDLIIANLPYVPKKEYEKLKKGLIYEPLLALVDNADDFSLFEKLITQLPARMNRNAQIIVELDPSYAKPFCRLIKKSMKNKHTKIYKDIHGLERFVMVY